MDVNTSQKKYDVAFSLCKEDYHLAAAINKKLNPNIHTFFYGHNQQELICKSGPEEFAKIFREKSKLVVILYRNDWSKSYYTELEKNAIIDRTKSGFDFLLIIQMEPGASPPWYPETRIYTKAFEHTVEDLVRFIEFKLTELGISYKPVTFYDKIKSIEDSIEFKEKKMKYLRSQEINKTALAFLHKFIDTFNSYIEKIKEQKVFSPCGWKGITKNELNSGIEGEISIMHHKANFSVINIAGWKPSSQNFYLRASWIKNNSVLIREPVVYRLNVDKDNYAFMGWSKQTIIERAKVKLFEVYFPHESSNYYLLDDELISNEKLVEMYLLEVMELIVKNEENKHQ